jgi:hypothetical protein
MYLEREIKKLFEDARDALLAGGAKDFETYATLNARYQVLRELNDYIKERKAALEKGEQVEDV